MNKSPQYYLHLDSLRGFAAFMVCLFHVNWTNHITANEIVRQSDLFVDFFFVLSGFVIYHVYQNIRARQDVIGFLRKRFARLYPLHFLTLVVHAVAFLYVATFLPSQWEKVSSVARMQNLVPRFFGNLLMLNANEYLGGDSFNSASWSIGAETVCYVLFALIFLLLFRWKSWVFFGFMLVSLILLLLIGGRLMAYHGVPRAGYGFFMGCLIYRLYTAKPHWTPAIAQKAGAWPIAFACAALFLSMWFAPELPAMSFLLFPPLFALILFLLIEPPAPVLRFLQLPPLLILGTLSYSIYMIHGGVKLAFSLILVHHFHLPYAYRNEDIAVSPWIGDVLVVLFIAAIISLSALSYCFYEHPMRIWLGNRRAVLKPGKLYTKPEGQTVSVRL